MGNTATPIATTISLTTSIAQGTPARITIRHMVLIMMARTITEEIAITTTITTAIMMATIIEETKKLLSLDWRWDYLSAPAS
jgi:hypothetical protein